MKTITTMSDTLELPHLAPALQAANNDAYLFDAANWQVLDANPAACKHLQYSLAALQAMTLLQLAPQWPDGPVPLGDGIGAHAIVQAQLQRRDSGVHAVRLRLTRAAHQGRALILAQGEEPRTPQASAAVTEGRLEQRELRQSRARLAELTAQIDKVRQQERTRLARELHDDLGGNLTAIKMALAMLARRLPAGDAALQDQAAYVDDLVDRSIDAVHRISLDLRPSMLELGLVAALDWQAKQFVRQAGIECVFSSNRKEIDLNPDQATGLFRIAQEALTNIARHAHASKVAVRLDQQRQHVRLCISDNGVGMRPLDRAKPQSFGIRSMSERASALGGALQLANAPAGGTLLTIKIRLSTPREAIIAAAASAGTQHGPRQPDVSKP
ncbi:hypothetical protein CD932_04270 [Janthinobacterium sp. PC23-8]|nr:hypothetical protein CD932_04270 [Janthinobacterium sp. PC23-8]